MKLELEMEIKSLDELQSLADRLAARFQKGDWIWLEGELGAGKSTLVRQILQAWGWEGPVPSPTYALMQEYEPWDGGPKVIHIDGFRLGDSKSPEMPWDYREWKDSILFVEWPERTGLPTDRFQWKIQIDGPDESEMRRIQLISQPFS